MLFSATCMLAIALYKPEWAVYVFYALVIWAFGKEAYDYITEAQPLIGAAIDVGFYLAGLLITTRVLGATGKI